MKARANDLCINVLCINILMCKYIQIFMIIKPFSELSCPVDRSGVILEETSPIQIEMFHHRIKGDQWE